MPVPQKLPQIPVLPAGYPNLRKPILLQQLENMLTILAVRLMLAHSLGSDLGRIHKPQLDVQFCQQSLEPACVSTGLHPQTNGFSLAGKLAVELLRQLAMLQPLLFHFSRFCIHIRNLLEARMVIASYNNHVGSFLRALVGLHHQSLSGAGSRHCHGINFTSNPAVAVKPDYFKLSMCPVLFTTPIEPISVSAASISFRRVF